ncbi:MAG: DegV family protein [Clostridia bacterium]|nr:DegV family protein [Clostridia bacterium]
MSYVIVTDSAANLSEEMYDSLGINVVSLSFHVDGKEYKSYEKDKKTDLQQFYNMMRNKEMITTSLVDPDRFITCFEEILKEGKDVLYIGFSSGLSGTYQSSTIAAADLAERYPDRKILTVDSLCASIGQGLLVYYAAKMKEEGKTIEEVATWAEEHRLNVCHWFTCDDLFFLKRGGRISGATAVVGSLLQVKPVMHVDNNGKLAVVTKARGRKQAISSLVAAMEKTVQDPQKQLVCICHGDCLEDAELLKKLILEKFSVKDVFIHYLDPVIGAHAGPGTLAVFYMGTDRY